MARTAELRNVTLLISYQTFLSSRLLSYLCTLHSASHNPVTITLTLDCPPCSMIGSLCYTVDLEQFVFSIMCTQVMGCLPTTLSRSRTSKKVTFFFSFSFFFNCFGKGEAVNAHKTVWCVTEKHKQKRDKSDIKGFSYSVKQGSSFTVFFFVVVVAITVLCYFYCSNL